MTTRVATRVAARVRRRESRGPGRRLRVAGLVLLQVLAVGALVVLGSTGARADEVYTRPSDGVWSVSGHGFGHGRGMSQWGAYGAAAQGVPWTTILTTYYPGTTLTTVANGTVRVRLTADPGQLRVAASPGLVAVEANGRRTALGGTATAWRLVPSGAGGLRLESLTGSTWTAVPLGGSTNVTDGGVRFENTAQLHRVFRADGTSTAYRGAPGAYLSGTVVTVLRVPLESYLRGVVPRESPASWPDGALRAQSVAARTYAASAVARNVAQRYDICDTTSCQVFSGTTAYSASGAATPLEYATSDAAIAGSAGTILTYQGAPAFAEFSASNGGWTTAGDFPYLTARPDPWDGTAPGDPVHSWKATLRATDLEARYPQIGTLSRIVITSRDGHGDWGGRVLSARLDGSAGSVTVSGYSIMNAHPYPTWSDGIRSPWFTLDGQQPIGQLDGATWAGNGIQVRGWAIDPDVPTPIAVVVSVDGVDVKALTAGLRRDDVGRAYPLYGSLHGYDVVVPAGPGTHMVCTRGRDTAGVVPDSTLGCRSVVVPATIPVGHLDSVTWTSSGIRVQGWAVDPDTSASIGVHVHVDGTQAAVLLASVSRPDVATAYPSAGPLHGFDLVLQAAPGTHQVCVWAINAGDGAVNPSLGCLPVAVPRTAPFGMLDAATSTGTGIRASGWAIDPDTSASIGVHLLVDGRQAAVFIARDSRPDVAAVYPGSGPLHGYAVTVPAGPGTHSVCAWAINAGAGTVNPLLGCRTVRIP